MGLAEDKVKLVLGRDMNPTGEAFCEFSGDGANIKEALLKDKAHLGTCVVEVFKSSLEEMQRIIMMGKPVV